MVEATPMEARVTRDAIDLWQDGGLESWYGTSVLLVLSDMLVVYLSYALQEHKVL